MIYSYIFPYIYVYIYIYTLYIYTYLFTSIGAICGRFLRSPMSVGMQLCIDFRKHLCSSWEIFEVPNECWNAIVYWFVQAFAQLFGDLWGLQWVWEYNCVSFVASICAICGRFLRSPMSVGMQLCTTFHKHVFNLCEILKVPNECGNAVSYIFVQAFV